MKKQKVKDLYQKMKNIFEMLKFENWDMKIFLYPTFGLIASILLWKGITIMSKKLLPPQIISQSSNRNLKGKRSLNNKLSDFVNRKLNNDELEDEFLHQTEMDINGKIIL